MNQTVKGICSGALGGAFWGLSGVFAKFLFMDGIDAKWLVSVRLLFGGVILIAFLFLKQRKEIFDILRESKDRISLILFAVLGMFLVQFTYFMAIDASNPATATILQYLFPIIVMICTLCYEKRAPEAREIVVLGMVFAGVFLLITHGSIDSISITGAALFWGIFSAAAAAYYSIQPKKLLAKFGSSVTVGWGLLTGGIPCIPFMIKDYDPVIMSTKNILLLGGVVIVGTVLAFSLYLEGVRMVGSMTGSLLASVEPLVAAVCTAVLLKEHFQMMDYTGMALIIAGVSLLTAGKALFDKISCKFSKGKNTTD